MRVSWFEPARYTSLGPMSRLCMSFYFFSDALNFHSHDWIYAFGQILMGCILFVDAIYYHKW